jgi:hypothetical protein
MYGDFDEMLLGPEAIVTLPFDPVLPDAQNDGAIDDIETLRGEAWARHSNRTQGMDGAGASSEPLDDYDLDMREMIRQVLALRWD